MELSVAKYLADIPAPVAAFVVDCLPNMDAGTQLVCRTQRTIYSFLAFCLLWDAKLFLFFSRRNFALASVCFVFAFVCFAA